MFINGRLASLATPDGNTTLFVNTLRRSKNGRIIEEREIKSEEEYLDVYKDYFGIEVPPMEKESMETTDWISTLTPVLAIVGLGMLWFMNRRFYKNW